MTRKWTPWLVAAGTGTLVAIPPLYTLLRSGSRGVFNFVRADAFLYLAVAKRSSLTWYTFDGETATHGFHPLWQFMPTALHRVIGGDTERLLIAGFLLTVLVASAGVAMASVTIRRWKSRRFERASEKVARCRTSSAANMSNVSSQLLSRPFHGRGRG